jgi:hypothetical protein
MNLCAIPGLGCGLNQTVALLRCYLAYICTQLPTFQENLSVSSSRVKQAEKNTNIGSNLHTWAT